MALSTAAKAGIGGSLGTVAVGGPIAAYASWDHITLYEVEREVLNKEDLKLKITVPTSSSAGVTKITIEAPKSTESDNGFTTKLKTNYSWSCEIAISPKDSGGTVTTTNLETNLKKHLPSKDDSDITKEKIENKKLLVKICAKHRSKTSKPPSHTEVISVIEAKEEEKASTKIISIKKHPELEKFLK